MLVEVPPLKSRSIAVKYYSDEPNSKGDTYDLRLQKQIGVDQTEVSHTYIRPKKDTSAIGTMPQAQSSQTFSLLNDKTLHYE
jgi:hypothetical protein